MDSPVRSHKSALTMGIYYLTSKEVTILGITTYSKYLSIFCEAQELLMDDVLYISIGIIIGLLIILVKKARYL